MTPKERKELVKKAVAARWGKAQPSPGYSFLALASL